MIRGAHHDTTAERTVGTSIDNTLNLDKPLNFDRHHILDTAYVFDTYVYRKNEVTKLKNYALLPVLMFYIKNPIKYTDRFGISKYTINVFINKLTKFLKGFAANINVYIYRDFWKKII